MASRGDQIVDYMIGRLRLPDDLSGVPESIEDLVVDDYPLRQGDGTRIRVYPFEEEDAEISQWLTLHRMLVKLELMVLVRLTRWRRRQSDRPALRLDDSTALHARSAARWSGEHDTGSETRLGGARG
jgi:hypothetical protein